MRVALYARVSTTEQTTVNQLIELRQYCAARSWQQAVEYVDTGISGSKDSRPALDNLMRDAKRRRVDTLIVWKLDRLGRSLRHLILLLDELTALGVAFISLGEGIDTSTPAGRLQLHVLGAIAEFERDRIRERVKAGLARVKAQGQRLGRPKVVVPLGRLASVSQLSLTAGAAALGVSRSTLKRWRRRVQKTSRLVA
jgi:DNA invertase Pin-like site-specific DNA recombinase